MPVAGWYGDPWGHAGLRWWDGWRWTGSVSGDPPRVLSGGLAALMGDADRIAVIDVETTGLYNKDRVVEIAIVTLSPDGRVIDEFDTLINPARDVGPTWIHRITASMVHSAPPFADVAGQVAARVNGAVCVGHNFGFDARMVGGELQRAGIAVHWGSGLDTLSVTGCKLGQACSDFDVALDDAHRALADARATANLLLALTSLGLFTRSGRAARANPIELFAARLCTRDGLSNAPASTPYLAQLAAGVYTPPDVAPYVALLDAAIADLKLTPEERSELDAVAAELGLDDLHIERAHREFLTGLVDAAVADGVVTDGELDQLCRAAALLDVDIDVVTEHTDSYRSVADTLELTQGLEICFTGSAVDASGEEIDRADLEALAARNGMVAKSSVTAKGCSLLVAADTSTRSGKAGQARRHGVPVASVADFLAAVKNRQPLPVIRLEAETIVLICVGCGDSWASTRRSRNPLCANCK